MEFFGKWNQNYFSHAVSRYKDLLCVYRDRFYDARYQKKVIITNVMLTKFQACASVASDGEFKLELTRGQLDGWDENAHGDRRPYMM